jgi:Tol biopolymer transport system component
MRLALFFIASSIFVLGCGSDESPDSLSLVVEFPSRILSTNLIASENRAYVVNSLGSEPLPVTSTLYRVDLLSKESTELLTTEGYCDDGFVISPDETFAILSTNIQNSNGTETRIEMIDLETLTKKLLISAQNTFYKVYAVDPGNKFLLYDRYENGMNAIRKRNLVTDEDIQISGNENAVYVGLHPVTNEILVTTYTEFYWMDWDGIIKSEPVSGFTPISISTDGHWIVCKKDGDIYAYDINNKSATQVTNAGDNLNPSCFSADGTSILLSTDKDHANRPYLYELYTVDISGGNLKRLTVDLDADFPIGFFQQDTRILFTSTRNDKALYSIRL